MAEKNQPNGNLYTSKAPEDDESHQMISSLFLGPHAENYEYFKSNIISILEYTRDARLNYFPEDGVSCFVVLLHFRAITQERSVKDSTAHQPTECLWWLPNFAVISCLLLLHPF